MGGLSAIRHAAPFFAAAALAIVNLAYGLFVLPESLRRTRRPFHWRRANTLGTIIEMRKYPVVWALAAVLFLWTLGHQVLPTTWAFYTKEKFGWSPTEVGLSLAFAGMLMAGVQAGLTRVLCPGWANATAVLVGLIAGGLSYMGYALARQGWMMYAVMLVGVLAGLTFPSLNALMSHQMPQVRQGELQGAVASTVQPDRHRRAGHDDAPVRILLQQRRAGLFSGCRVRLFVGAGGREPVYVSPGRAGGPQ